MDGQAAYGELTAHLRRMAALGQVAGLLNWDQETQMPAKGAAQRAEHAGAVAAALHALATDPRIPDWTDAVEAAGMDGAVGVNVAEARRTYHRAVRVPARLAERLAHQAAATQAVWEAARPTGDLAAYLPALAEMLALKRAEAESLAAADGTPYDALLEEYEPGMTAAQLEAVFGSLRPRLVALRAGIAERGAPPVALRGRFPGDRQMVLARRLATVFGYDWQAGRLDLAAHPSSSGTLGDVRITTRIDEADPRDCMYSTVHETGHAVYEQNLDPAFAFQPVGAEASMGVHEAMSRLFENQLGRSRAFCEFLHAAMTEAFGDAGAGDPDTLYRAVNAVETGFIRTEADEVHYNLHVMLRFDLERDLIAGALDAADLEGAWNARFEADFGRAVPDPRRGLMQDVHWSAGLFGYFPTYTLGNVYAGEIHAALRRDLSDLDADLARGRLADVLDWLRERVYRHGGLYPPAELIARACGRPPTAAPLLEYLEEKYRA